MRVLWVTPPTMNVETIVKSLKEDFFPDRFDANIKHLFLPQNYIDLLIHHPHIIFYIGGVAKPYALDIDELLRLREKGVKTVFINVDTSDEAWYPLFEEYAKLDVFSLVVGSDGNTKWPRRSQDLNIIGCIDPTAFTHEKKAIDVAVCFGKHPYRISFLSELKGYLKTKVVSEFPRQETYGLYSAYAKFVSQAKIFLNIFQLSDDHIPPNVHFKMFEAAYGGALFLEKRGSTLEDWFARGLDFLSYDSPKQAAKLIESILEEEREDIVNMARQEIEEKYSPKAYWSQIFKVLG